MYLRRTLTMVVVSILLISLLTIASVNPVSAETPEHNQDVDISYPDPH